MTKLTPEQQEKRKKMKEEGKAKFSSNPYALPRKADDIKQRP